MQSLDFPSLIANGGELLDTELGIKSKLHREQIARAMKRLLLGIGELPSGPQVMYERSCCKQIFMHIWDC